MTKAYRTVPFDETLGNLPVERQEQIKHSIIIKVSKPDPESEQGARNICQISLQRHIFKTVKRSVVFPERLRFILKYAGDASERAVSHEITKIAAHIRNHLAGRGR